MTISSADLAATLSILLMRDERSRKVKKGKTKKLVGVIVFDRDIGIPGKGTSLGRGGDEWQKGKENLSTDRGACPKNEQRQIVEEGAGKKRPRAPQKGGERVGKAQAPVGQNLTFALGEGKKKEAPAKLEERWPLI